MKIVDLRSDTITKPTPAMRNAMSQAEVGDDVFREDPTVNRLEELAAERLGKEDGLFVASGTMANLVCQLTHCGRGDEIILGDQAHVFYYEQGGCSAMGGIHPRTIPNQNNGTVAVEDIEAAIRPDNIHFPRTRLILLENTHNRCSGSPLDTEYMSSVRKLADEYGLKIHMDGARLFNAAEALGVPAAELAQYADSVSICLSKGLAAPVGSIICCNRNFVDDARRNRKVLGGGMRQAGILAAAGIIAITEMTGRLREDHTNADRLAKGLADMEGLAVDLDMIRTNIVFIDIQRENLTSEELVKRLEVKGVRMLATGPKQLRAVTHYHISPEDIDATLEVFDKAL
jgi:threonine aldolase